MRPWVTYDRQLGVPTVRLVPVGRKRPAATSKRVPDAHPAVMGVRRGCALGVFPLVKACSDGGWHNQLVGQRPTTIRAGPIRGRYRRRLRSAAGETADTRHSMVEVQFLLHRMATSGLVRRSRGHAARVYRLRRDISAPARGLTGVRWVSTGWSEHVPVSRLVRLTPRKDIRQAPHCQRTHHIPDVHPLTASDEDTVGGAN